MTADTSSSAAAATAVVEGAAALRAAASEEPMRIRSSDAAVNAWGAAIRMSWTRPTPVASPPGHGTVCTMAERPGSN